jgi:hypothetical protein
MCLGETTKWCVVIAHVAIASQAATNGSNWRQDELNVSVQIRQCPTKCLVIKLYFNGNLIMNFLLRTSSCEILKKLQCL